MNIGIDARPLISEYPTGIGVYLIQVLKNICKEPGYNFFLYTTENIRCQEPFLKDMNLRIVPGRIGTLQICYGLKKQLIEDKIDVFWGTQHMLPLNVPNIKKVVTVHDLALLINPLWGSFQNAVMQNIFTRCSCRAADHIITVSEATKRDVVRMLSVKESHISVIMPGCIINNTAPDEQEIHKTKTKMGIEGKNYFLYIGTIEPRKNIISIVKAFNLLNDRTSRENHLVIAGGLGWRYNPILKEINLSKYLHNIHLPGYISEAEKKVLFMDAAAFLFPSNYEGFGTPVVEAMDAGLPVITAKVSSLPEVGGSLAFYVDDPHDIKGIADRMEQCLLLNNAQRQKLKSDSMEWAKRFNYEKCAKNILQELLKFQ